MAALVVTSDELSCRRQSRRDKTTTLVRVAALRATADASSGVIFFRLECVTAAPTFQVLDRFLATAGSTKNSVVRNGHLFHGKEGGLNDCAKSFK